MQFSDLKILNRKVTPNQESTLAISNNYVFIFSIITKSLTFVRKVNGPMISLSSIFMFSYIHVGNCNLNKPFFPNTPCQRSSIYWTHTHKHALILTNTNTYESTHETHEYTYMHKNTNMNTYTLLNLGDNKINVVK